MLTKEMVEQADDLRIRVMVGIDIAAMETLLSDDMVWVHASGGTDTKQSMIEKFATGAMKYHSLERKEQSIRLFGDCAVTMGVVDMDGQVGDLRKQVQSRYMGVWHKNGDTVQLASWLSVRMA